MNEKIIGSDRIVCGENGNIEHEYDMCIGYEDIATVERGMFTDVSRVPIIITVRE